VVGRAVMGNVIRATTRTRAMTTSEEDTDGRLLARLSVIGRMTLAMSRIVRAEDLYREALATIVAITGTPRAAVLLFDPDGVMRFKAWSHLSDRYRAAVEGHTPWSPGQADPEPIFLSDPLSAPDLRRFAEVIEAEGIRSMAMIPLVAGGGTIGKFMIYHHARHVFSAEEMQLVQNVAAHTAFAIDRQRAVDALQKSEERYRSVVDHLREVVFQTDAAGAWTFLNSTWEEVTGFPVPRALGRPWSDFVHPDDRPRHAAQLELLAHGERKECRSEVRCLRLDGGFRWVEFVARLTRNGGGGFVGTSGTLTDITERKATAAALQEAESRLRETQRLESLGVLAGGIAHDFNNLLMGVLGNAGIALAELPPGSPVAPVIQDVLLAARRAAELTRQLLAYSGRGKFMLQRVDLSALVKESAHLLGTAISRKATTKYEFTADLPAIEADATQLRQVAMNLLANASDALGDHPGAITVRTDLVQADRAELDRAVNGGELAPGPYVALEVRDTGCGMDEETGRRMFDPFFTTKVHGRGLGLAAVLGIVRGHQGTIRVESAPGRGTMVRVLLPVARSAEVDPATTGAEPDSVTLGATVLLVDDEELVRRTTGRMLASSGCRVEIAENGRRALEVLGARDGQVDLVLLDLTMPELSGEETLVQLRARWPNLPVVLTSGFTADATRPSGPGPTDFLQKPYDPVELQAVIRRAILATPRTLEREAS
jgi:two-component system, cell cycle sensor histidine kinase and response regulator CckA